MIKTKNPITSEREGENKISRYGTDNGRGTGSKEKKGGGEQGRWLEGGKEVKKGRK
jgi:hypothetical protein